MASVTGDSSDPGIPAVYGVNKVGDGVFGDGGDNGRGVVGVSTQHTGVEGTTTSGAAVFGKASGNGRGIVGIADTGTAIYGETNSTIFAAITGISLSPSLDSGGGASAGVWGKRVGYFR